MGTELLKVGGVAMQSSGLLNTIVSASSIGGLINHQLINTISRYGKIFDGFDEDIETSMKDVSLQTNTYGRIIPEVFGTMRLAGNIIWCSQIKQEILQEGHVVKKDGTVSKGTKIKRITASFAIAICNGIVDDIAAIYADNSMINLGNINASTYRGTEDQMPNSTMQAFLGIDNTPAFRGLCYVVFTDFRLDEYGGRIPNFTFDIKRTKFSRSSLNHIKKAEDMITCINIIPGGGEFVYDTMVQYSQRVISTSGRKIKIGKASPVNMHNNHGKSNAIVSLDNLQSTIPNIKWTSIVISWFGDNLNASHCNIYPACESRDITTEPDLWSVGEFDRDSARLISKDLNNRPNYGGTPSDLSIVRYVSEIKRRGIKVCLYPMIFMDIPDKPWRGKISGSPNDILTFFQRSRYREFILHYARLVKDKVDAFIIGSEFIGLTKVKDGNNNFPAVREFCRLASDVKNILGQNTIVTYAADWSEYHHTDGGWYNMDELWSCPDIDVIGIDQYFPITNSHTTITNIDQLVSGFESGEGYDIYYEDGQKTRQKPLGAAYAWKNIRYFWENEHWNPNGTKTSWQIKSKPIWFTEYGFPSVDCATNSPNVFFSGDSVESGFPHLSRGNVDFEAQKAGIIATEQKWMNSDMVKQKFLWTWDARPYPFFPSLLDVWSDGKIWEYAHFVNGKLGNSSLAEIVSYLCDLAGLSESDYDVSDLDLDIHGYTIDTDSRAISNISHLSKLFFFDAYMLHGKIVFKMLSNVRTHHINEDNMILDGDQNYLSIEEEYSNNSSIKKMNILYINRHADYKISTTYAENYLTKNKPVCSYKTNLALSEQDALNIARTMLSHINSTNINIRFKLSIDFINLLPLDIATIKVRNKKYNIRIRDIRIVDHVTIEVIGQSCDPTIYYNVLDKKSQEVPRDTISLFDMQYNIMFECIEIPNIYQKSGDNIVIHIAACSSTNIWRGCTVFISYDDGKNYHPMDNIFIESHVGKVVTCPKTNANHHLIDDHSKIVVAFQGQNPYLESATIDELLNHHYLAMVGDEIISFINITENESGLVEFSELLRGRFGTEKEIKNHIESERFILLTNNYLQSFNINENYLNKYIQIKVVPSGESIYNCNPQIIKLSGKSRKSFDILDHYVSKSESGDIIITWNPRPSIETDFFESENRHINYRYDITISKKDGVGLRKFIIRNNHTAIYTISMQIIDFDKQISCDEIDVTIFPANENR